MTAMPVAERMTAAEFLALEPEPDDRWRWARLIGGEIVMDSPPIRHQGIAGEILFALMTWTRAQPGRGLALMSLPFVLGEHDVYPPDVHWHRAGRAPARDAEPPYPLPDLVIEVRAPGTWCYDIGPKKAAYERAGVAELWLVDTPAQTVIVLRRSQPAATDLDTAHELIRGDALTSSLLTGFAVQLDAVFGE